MLVSPLVRTLRAEELAPLKRLFIFFTPLGAIRDAWMPTGSEQDFQLGETLAPLAEFQSKLIVLDGLHQQKEIYSSANHQEMGGILTGKRVLGDNESSSHAHISIDQFLAGQSAIGGETVFPSIELAAWQGRYESFKGQIDHMYMSAKGPNLAVIPEGLPQAAFDSIFDGFTTPSENGEAPVDPRRESRRSVLDTVAKELEAVQRRLRVGGTERAKIDQHLTSIRELEKRLVDTPFTGAGCEPPARPGAFPIDDDNTLDIRFRLQLDIAIAAIACDRTRIVALTAEGGRSDARHPWLGIDDKFHEISHEPHFEGHKAINLWYAEQFRYLLERLDAIPEANGSLLDNTCVAWVSEQGCRMPNEKHMRTNVPYIIAGSCGGHFRTGRFVDCGGLYSNSFLITLMNAMGIEGDTFGEVTAAPLPDMT
jgi:hypothetical protein